MINSKTSLRLIVHVLFAISLITAMQGQSLNEFSFKKLKNQKIKFYDISMGSNFRVYDSKILITEIDTVTPQLYNIKLSKEQKIFHECYNYITDKTEYLTYYNQKLNIDSLLIHNSNNHVFKERNHVLFTGDIVSFNFKGNEFILLSARDRLFLRNTERNFWIVLQVENKKIIDCFSLIDGYVAGPDCFADFNNDGYLDYLNWRTKEEKIEFYSLKQNKIVKDENHFIIVKPSKNQIILMNEDDIETLYEILDRKSSKWFFKL